MFHPSRKPYTRNLNYLFYIEFVKNYYLTIRSNPNVVEILKMISIAAAGTALNWCFMLRITKIFCDFHTNEPSKAKTSMFVALKKFNERNLNTQARESTLLNYHLCH